MDYIYNMRLSPPYNREVGSLKSLGTLSLVEILFLTLVYSNLLYT